MFTVNSYSCSESLNRLVSQFKLSNPTLGRIGTFVHSIRLKDTEPVVHKGYAVPISKLEVTRKELARLEEIGVIRPSRSEYRSPAFPIYQKYGKVRIMVDYREINKKT